MNFKEIVSRLTGISCPFFGVSWTPPEADITVARKLLLFLEDRRVLYSPSEMEIPQHCVKSIKEIRSFLTEIIMKVDEKSQLAQSIQAMRANCRKFMDTVITEERDAIEFAHKHGHWASWVFMGALGELRGVFGIHIAQIAVSYGLDVSKDLDVIIPKGRED